MPPAIIAAIIGAVAGLGTAGIGAAASNPKDPCAKDCKEKCKGETGWLFSGRQKCIKECRSAQCTAISDEPVEEESDINWWYVAAGILFIAAILVWIFRAKFIKVVPVG